MQNETRQQRICSCFGLSSDSISHSMLFLCTSMQASPAMAPAPAPALGPLPTPKSPVQSNSFLHAMYDECSHQHACTRMWLGLLRIRDGFFTLPCCQSRAAAASRSEGLKQMSIKSLFLETEDNLGLEIRISTFTLVSVGEQKQKT